MQVYNFYDSFYCLLAPLRAPGLVNANSISSMSLIVKWNHVADEHFQGELIGYEIK